MSKVHADMDIYFINGGSVTLSIKNMRVVFKMMKLSFSRNGSVADVHED